MPSVAARNPNISVWRAGEAVTRGQVLYAFEDNVVKVASCDDRQTRKVVGFAFKNAPLGAKVLVLGRGELPGFLDLSPGTQYFLQENGAIGTSVPSGQGKFTLKVGYPKTTKVFYVQLGEINIRS